MCGPVSNKGSKALNLPQLAHNTSNGVTANAADIYASHLAGVSLPLPLTLRAPSPLRVDKSLLVVKLEGGDGSDVCS